MAITITGGGKGNEAVVNDSNELAVKADSNTRGAVISATDGRAFIWTTAYSATSGDEIIFLKNTSNTRRLFIDEIDAGSVEAGLFEVFNVSNSTAPAGTTSTGQNLNLGSNLLPESSSLGNVAVTGLTIGERLGLHRTDANGDAELIYDDEMILGSNNAITVTYTQTTGGSGLVNVMIRGYYDI